MSRAYSIQPSGATANSDVPYVLTIYYNPDLLGDIDPSTLGIYRYDATPDVMDWQPIGGTHYADQQNVQVSTDLFGTFVLMGVDPALPEETNIYLPLIGEN
ncbi:MAG: hypothetical protein R2873_21290 [Caldilineaceae bacterium]